MLRHDFADYRLLDVHWLLLADNDDRFRVDWGARDYWNRPPTAEAVAARHGDNEHNAGAGCNTTNEGGGE